MKNVKALRVAALSQKKLTLNYSSSYNLRFSPLENNWLANRIFYRQPLLIGRAL